MALPKHEGASSQKAGARETGNSQGYATGKHAAHHSIRHKEGLYPAKVAEKSQP
jgi:hypothetical protein